jgi:hypothetical protein
MADPRPEPAVPTPGEPRDAGHAAFFRLEDGLYVGNDPARGPWDAGACHGGPVAAALARELEGLVPELRLVRLTVELHRPVPIAGFRVAVSTTRAGRNVVATTAVLTDGDGRGCATAGGLHLRAAEVGALPTVAEPPPDFDGAAPGPFPITAGRHDLPMFGTAVEARYPPGEDGEPGPTTLWLRTPAIVDGEEPSPFQVVCPLADCGNAVSRNAGLDRIGFVNPDLTITVVRPPQGRWLASRARSYWEQGGIGLADATLFDRHGVVGRAQQTLLLR